MPAVHLTGSNFLALEWQGWDSDGWYESRTWSALFCKKLFDNCSSGGDNYGASTIDGAFLLMLKKESKSMRLFIAGLLTTLVAACSSLPRYEEPPAGARTSHASIESSGSKLSLCGITGSPICESRVNVIDGKKVDFFGSAIRVQAGPHRIQLACIAKRGLAIGAMVGFFRMIDVVIAEGGRYRVESRWENDACRISLVEADSGKEVQAKDVAAAP